MRHTLRLNGVIIGHSDLEHIEPDLGRARGRFRPGLGYELVQPIFRLFAESVSPDGVTLDASMLERYHRSRDALPLELQDGDGHTIPTHAIHIADHSIERGDDAIELDVLIADEAYWRSRERDE